MSLLGRLFPPPFPSAFPTAGESVATLGPVVSVSMTPSNPVPGEGDSIFYAITVSNLTGNGSVQIAQGGDLGDSDFNTAFLTALATAAAGSVGVSLSGSTLSFTAAFRGSLTFSRTIVSTPAAQATHTVTLSNPFVLALGAASASLVISSHVPVPTPSSLVPGGVNLASAEFGGTSAVLGTGYTYPKAADLTYFYNRGCRVFRVPFRWYRMQPTAFGALSAADLDGMMDLATAAAALPGAILMPDAHDFGRYRNVKINDPSLAGALADLWTKLITQLRTTGATLRISLMNEPEFDWTPTEWRDAAKAEIALLRTAGITETIQVPGMAYTGAHSWVSSGNAAAWAGQLPAGCIIEMHQYLDSDSSGTNLVDAVTGAGSTRLVAATSWLRAQGYAGALGEFGFGSSTSMMTEAEALLDYMEANSDVWDNWTAWAGGPFWSSTYGYSLQPLGGASNPTDRVQMRKLMDHMIPIASNQAPTDIGLSNTVSSANLAQGGLIGSLTAFDPNAADFYDFALTDDAGGRFQIVGSQLQAGAATRSPGTTYQITIQATDRAGATVSKTFSCPVLAAPNVLLTRASALTVNEGQDHTIRTSISSAVPGSGFDIWHSAFDAAQFSGTWESVVRAAFETKGYSVTVLHPTKMQIRAGNGAQTGNIDIVWPTLADATTEGATYQANFFIDNPKGVTLNTDKTSLTAAAFIADTSVTPGWAVTVAPGNVLAGGTVTHTISGTGVINGMAVTLAQTGTAADSTFDVTLDDAIAAAVATETGLSYNASTNVLSVTGAWDGSLTFTRVAVDPSSADTTYGVTLSNPVSSAIGTASASVTIRGQVANVVVKAVDYAAGETTDTVYQTRNGAGFYESAAGVWTSVAADTIRTGDKGLLLEPEATNLLPNPLGVGTSPTGWGLPTGVTKVGSGTENGLPYVDLRWQRSAVSGSSDIWFAPTTGCPVSLNAPYTFSVGAKIVAGTHAGFDYILMQLKGRNSVGGSVQSLVARETSIGVNTVWYQVTKSFTTSTVVYGLPVLTLHGNGTDAIDVTFRFYAPMFQAGACRTLPVLPAAGVQAVASREADRVSILYAPPAEGSFILDWDCIDRPYTPGQCLLSLYSDASNCIKLTYGTSGRLRLEAYISGVSVGAIEGGFITPGFRHKAAFRYSLNDYALVLDGNLIGTLSSASVPTITAMSLGRDPDTLNNAGLRVRKWTSRNDLRSNANLITDTAKLGVAFSPGVNQAGGEFGSGAFYPNTSNLDYYLGKGIKQFRVPMKWERIQPTLFGALDVAHVGPVKAFMDGCVSRGQKVILDLHNYGKFNGVSIGNAEVPVTAFADVWSKLAAYFAGHEALLGYDLMNEPSGMLPDTKTGMQAAIDAIRLVDVASAIYVEGSASSGAYNWGIFNDRLQVSDPSNNVIYSAHAYFDNDRSGIYDQTTDYVNPQWAADSLQPFLDFVKANGYRGHIGETGWPGVSTGDRYNENGDIALKVMHEHGLQVSYWAGGRAWGTSYTLNIEPSGGVDKPQMAILQRHVREATPPVVVQPDPVIVLTGSSIVEGAAAGTDVGVLSVVNGVGTYTYTLTASAGSRFALSGSTLEAGSVATDYETATSHSITISAQDDANAYAPIVQTFTILVSDVNENVAPAFTSPVTVSPATAKVGVTATITPGTATGSPVPTRVRRFKVDGVVVATGTTYTWASADEGKVASVEDVATNVAGSATSTATLGTVAPADVVEVPVDSSQVPFTPDMLFKNSAGAFAVTGGGFYGVDDDASIRDASDVQAVANGTTRVHTIRDRSGQNNHLVAMGVAGGAATDANRGLYGVTGRSIGGYATVTMGDGVRTHRYVQQTAVTTSTRTRIYIRYVRPPATASQRVAISDGSGNFAYVLQTSTATVAGQTLAGTNGVMEVVTSEGLRTHIMRRDLVNNNISGKVGASEVDAASGTGFSGTNNRSVIGNVYGNGAAGEDADFVTFLDYPGILPRWMEHLFLGWAAHKFGFASTLPDDFPFKLAAPTVDEGTLGLSDVIGFNAAPSRARQVWWGTISEWENDAHDPSSGYTNSHYFYPPEPWGCFRDLLPAELRSSTTLSEADIVGTEFKRLRDRIYPAGAERVIQMRWGQQCYRGSREIYTAATFTASISGTTMTVTSINPGGEIVPGMFIAGTGVIDHSWVRGQNSGTTGGVGSYSVVPPVNYADSNQSVSSRTMTAYVARRWGERWQGQNAQYKRFFANVKGTIYCVSSPEPYWKNNAAAGRGTLRAGGSYPWGTTLDSIRSTDPTQYWAQFRAFAAEQVENMEWWHQNICPVIGHDNNEMTNDDVFGTCTFGDELARDWITVLLEAVDNSTILDKANFLITVNSMNGPEPLTRASPAFADPRVQASIHRIFGTSGSHEANQDLAKTNYAAYIAPYKKAGLQDGVNNTEFEKGSPITTFSAQQAWCAGTMLNRLNYKTLCGAKVHSQILHGLKWGGQASGDQSTSGYAFGKYTRAVVGGDPPAGEPARGTWVEQPWNSNGYYMDLDNIPYGTTVLESHYPGQKYGQTGVFTVGGIQVTVSTKDAKLYWEAANQTASDITMRFWLGKSRTMRTRRYNISEVGANEIVTTGSIVTYTVPAYSGVASVEIAPVAPSVPGSISNLTVASVTATTAALAFTNATGATSHEVAISTNGGSSFGSYAALAGTKIVSGLTAGTAYVFKVRGVNGAGNGPASNNASATTASAGDTTAPTITSSASVSLAENAALSHSLTANETVTWSIVGGADQALFSLTGSTLSLPARNYEFPTDADGNNTYVVQVRATDAAANTTNQTITVTVTNVNEAPTDIALSASSFSLGAAQGTAIGTLSGTDPDAGASLTFSLTDSASNKVQVSGTSLQVGSSAASAGTFSITVRASDGTNTYDESFTITCVGAVGKLLLESASNILLEDGTSKLLMET